MKLKELIAALEQHDPEQPVAVGFANPHSYRGYYHELAFEPVADTTIGAMLVAALSAVGATYEGWKGGEFTMDRDTEVRIAYEGTADDLTGILWVNLLAGKAEVPVNWRDLL